MALALAVVPSYHLWHHLPLEGLEDVDDGVNDGMHYMLVCGRRARLGTVPHCFTGHCSDVRALPTIFDRPPRVAFGFGSWNSATLWYP